MTPPTAFDNAFALLAHDLLVANARDGLTPADSARYDAASAAFDALLRHVYPGLSPRAADRLRERVVHFDWKASDAAQDQQDNPLIVNRLRAHPASCSARWEVSCPDGTITPIGFWWSAMEPDDQIVEAACQAVKNVSRDDDPIRDREVIMGSWIPVD